jgi:hypothetical protein
MPTFSTHTVNFMSAEILTKLNIYANTRQWTRIILWRKSVKQYSYIIHNSIIGEI